MPVERPTPDPELDAELIRYVATTAGLGANEAVRVIADIVAWYRESVEAYVRRRHQQLQTRGVRNTDAYARIAAELRARVVAPPHLSERQVRRMIYG